MPCIVVNLKLLVQPVEKSFNFDSCTAFHSPDQALNRYSRLLPHRPCAGVLRHAGGNPRIFYPPVAVAQITHQSEF
jgi:hypothetical protein